MGNEQAPQYVQQAPQGTHQQQSQQGHRQQTPQGHRQQTPYQTQQMTTIPMRKKIQSPNPDRRFKSYNYVTDFSPMEQQQLVVFEDAIIEEERNDWEEAKPYIG